MPNDGSQTLLTAWALNEAAPPIWWHGGRGAVSAWGTWGGASLKLQHSPDGGTTFIDTDATNAVATSTAPGFEFGLPPCPIRLIASGGTAASLNASVNRI